jgi:Common central domain of tyrosinase
MSSQLNRRNFCVTAGAASLALLAQASFVSDPVAASSLFVRRNVGGMNAYDPVIAAYRKAVAAMQALPTTDPRSWSYQAAIHGTFTTPPQTAWNTCQHGNYFFWSWHRMYLYWFERICRRMACDDCFALPYWDYNNPAERQLPSMFRDPSSDLFISARNSAINSGAGSLPAWAVDYSAGLAQTSFNGASSSLEGLPHNQVHVLVGGLMGSVPTAAQDPIFFLHHCNMDRLWNLWLAQGGRIDPVFDNVWKNTKYTFFDEEGAQLEMTGCEILRAAQQLHYVYEGEPPQVNDFCFPILKWPPIIFEKEAVLRLPIPEIRLEQEPVTVPVDWKEARQKLSSLAERQDATLFLEIDGVEAEHQPGVAWQVYFGPATSGEPPDDSPYMVGAIALFGQGIHGELHNKEKFEPAKFTFPINRALSAGLKANQEHWTIMFIPRGVLIDGKPSRPKVESPVKIASVSITMETHKPGQEK